MKLGLDHPTTLACSKHYSSLLEEMKRSRESDKAGVGKPPLREIMDSVKRFVSRGRVRASMRLG